MSIVGHGLGRPGGLIVTRGLGRRTLPQFFQDIIRVSVQIAFRAVGRTVKIDQRVERTVEH